MLDIGWSEMLVIAVVAIVIIGPKDLPRALRAFGRWMSKARAMAREFQNSLDDIAREADLDDIKKQVEEVSRFDIKGELEKSMDPTGSDAGASDLSSPAAPGEGAGTPADDGEAAAPTTPEPDPEPDSLRDAPVTSEGRG